METKERKIQYGFTLDSRTAENLKIIGHGNRSRGIRIAVQHEMAARKSAKKEADFFEGCESIESNASPAESNAS